MKPPKGRTLVVAAPLLFVAGCLGGGCVGATVTPMDPGRIVYARLPHHVAPSPDATPFRFAMVHDVIHERYPRHGAAFYQERERLARERLAVVHPDSVTAFAAIDDIAVGLDRQGQTDEAIKLMRDKLKRQQELDRPKEDLYSSYANLGEFHIHKHLWAMLGGDETARKGVEEGRDVLRKSVAVNPTAHFGQEEWQIAAVQSLLDAGASPELLRKCDLIGNRLDVTIEVPKVDRSVYRHDGAQAIFGRPYYSGFTHVLYGHPMDKDYSDTRYPEQRKEIREYVTQVGGESPPKDSDAKHGRRAPFDEPAMWLIGEWRQGNGPNPHLALCLGEIMLRVGQRYVAWNCFERADRLAAQFSPRPEIQAFFRKHCWTRQTAIEESLPTSEVGTLRPKFESELAFGEAYQRDYQSYTEQKIRAGVSIGDPNFYDEFHAGRPAIASKVGPEEWYAGEVPIYEFQRKALAFCTWGLFAGGACVLIAGLIANLRSRV
ncbi:MAG TPA: hypothetical protein VHR66_22020 [Gemmataceae bacterium]|jgi:hypothetical protein|nr:hypothetical protein [Gemmataceae bacterium]